VLYGNVDLSQVDLAFNNGERITEVLVQEGAKDHTWTSPCTGLDTNRLKPQTATAELACQTQVTSLKRHWRQCEGHLMSGKYCAASLRSNMP
jgi:hypothetical protein